MACCASSSMFTCRKVIELDPSHPNWLYWADGYDAYRRGDYRESLEVFEKWKVPAFYWTYTLLSMTYGQLNMELEAQQAIAKLLELYPDHELNARNEFRIWFSEEDYIEHMIDGLRKAGLDVPDET